MNGSYDLNYFKKGISLNKNYIIERMRGNGIYGLYTPNNTDPKKLSRKFLLQVSKLILCFIVGSFY